MEENKRLYEKIYTYSEEEKEKLWKLIFIKNRIFLDIRKQELNKLLKK